MAASPQPPGALGSFSEEQLLSQLLPLLAGGPTERLGPGDDAAVLDLDGGVVLTTDSMVRGIDWRDDWSGPEDVAVKVVTQNLADVAAMGARPRSLLISLAADPATSAQWVHQLFAQLGAECRRYDVSAAGGDLSAAPAGVVLLSITAVGELGEAGPVTRSGARPGDVVAVTGPLGRSAVGLALLTEADTDRGKVDGIPAEALAHHRRPSCPLSQGPAAAAAGATAMIDISDGLLRDAHRLARASGVAIELTAEPLAADLNWAERYVSRPVARACVLGGGEEHSLLACFPDASVIPPWWRLIGRVGSGNGVRLDGRGVDPQGWDHFARNG